MYQLKGAAKVMVTNVTSLLKTVKAVEDEATRGTRALEATIEYIKQELTVFQSKDIPEKTSSPEESIRMTKGITMATAKAVAAGNSCRQEDVIATANLSRKAVSDMLIACKQASFYPDVSEEVRTRALRYGTECTLGYLDLLEHVLVGHLFQKWHSVTTSRALLPATDIFSHGSLMIQVLQVPTPVTPALMLINEAQVIEKSSAYFWVSESAVVIEIMNILLSCRFSRQLMTCSSLLQICFNFLHFAQNSLYKILLRTNVLFFLLKRFLNMTGQQTHIL
ncbi:talin-2 isoform 6 [Mus musculus]|uniref:talin-2 isoform 6 n=1 Tax=Mus musculus TaxID=10090 RepID=UPI0020424035|nr:talin-2 isoform 6 [Mus musculus]